MSSTSTTATLCKLYGWFTRLGYPKQIHYGGPQFTSYDFREKLKEWGIDWSISPPYHPPSNEAAERAVRTIKESLKKGSTLEQIMFRHRCTPLECGSSPAEFMLHRQPRTRLSAILPTEENFRNGNLGSYRRFSLGDPIWLRDFRPCTPKWQPGNVVRMIGVACCSGGNED